VAIEVKRYKHFEPGTLWTLLGIFVIGIGSLMTWQGTKINTTYRNNLSNEELKKEFKAILTDKQDKELVGFTGVQILDDKIIDNNKGYIRIKILIEYLNSKFSTPVTLKNSNREYQPVTIICDNDPERGPGFFVILPIREARTVFYFTDFLKFENFGDLKYVEDFVFGIFYDDFAFYFITNSGAIKVEPLKPIGTHIVKPIKIGTNLISRPFDGKSYEAANKMFPELASFFGRDFSKTFPELYGRSSPGIRPR